MIRLVTVMALSLVLQVGLFSAHAAAGTPQVTPVSAIAFGTLDETVDAGVQCLRGASACFGYGSENCCNEMEALGYIAAGTGSWWGAAIAAAYSYAYC